jgi:Lon protease-like protein
MSDSMPAEFAGTARLFPLPNLVLFPNVVQGLHIFEPRYRQLMNDVLTTDKLITLALLKPGWEDNYDDKPEIEPVACLGRVTWHEKLEDGRFNLRLRGLIRLRLLEEVPSDRLYRVARAEAIPEFAPDDLIVLTKLRRALADAVLPQFDDDGPARRQLQELFDGEMPLGQVCDVLGYALPLATEVKQSLLAEPHADRRAVALLDALRATTAHSARKFPPAFSPN